MKVFVSTKLTQGQRKNDFSFTNDNEYLRLGFECDGARVDDECGCRRALFGIDSALGTTTFTVVEADIPEEEFIQLYVKSLSIPGFEDDFREEALDLLALTSSFPVGAIVERRGDNFQVRDAN